MRKIIVAAFALALASVLGAPSAASQETTPPEGEASGRIVCDQQYTVWRVTATVKNTGAEPFTVIESSLPGYLQGIEINPGESKTQVVDLAYNRPIAEFSATISSPAGRTVKLVGPMEQEALGDCVARSFVILAPPVLNKNTENTAIEAIELPRTGSATVKVAFLGLGALVFGILLLSCSKRLRTSNATAPAP